MVQFPPGFRFHPTDEELVNYYLTRKVGHKVIEGNIIAELDLYSLEPWKVSERSTLTGNEWYFFSPRDRKYPNGSRTNRATEKGYWKATGKDRSVLGSGNGAQTGMKKTLVFYLGRAPKGSRTDWIMHEYRLEGPEGRVLAGQDAYVLCRILNRKGDANDKGPARAAAKRAEDGSEKALDGLLPNPEHGVPSGEPAGDEGFARLPEAGCKSEPFSQVSEGGEAVDFEETGAEDSAGMSSPSEILAAMEDMLAAGQEDLDYSCVLPDRQEMLLGDMLHARMYGGASTCDSDNSMYDSMYDTEPTSSSSLGGKELVASAAGRDSLSCLAEPPLEDLAYVDWEEPLDGAFNFGCGDGAAGGAPHAQASVAHVTPATDTFQFNHMGATWQQAVGPAGTADEGHMLGQELEGTIQELVACLDDDEASPGSQQVAAVGAAGGADVDEAEAATWLNPGHAGIAAAGLEQEVQARVLPAVTGEGGLQQGLNADGAYDDLVADVLQHVPAPSNAWEATQGFLPGGDMDLDLGRGFRLDELERREGRNGPDSRAWEPVAEQEEHMFGPFRAVERELGGAAAQGGEGDAGPTGQQVALEQRPGGQVAVPEAGGQMEPVAQPRIRIRPRLHDVAPAGARSVPAEVAAPPRRVRMAIRKVPRTALPSGGAGATAGGRAQAASGDVSVSDSSWKDATSPLGSQAPAGPSVEAEAWPGTEAKVDGRQAGALASLLLEQEDDGGVFMRKKAVLAVARQEGWSQMQTKAMLAECAGSCCVSAVELPKDSILRKASLAPGANTGPELPATAGTEASAAPHTHGKGGSRGGSESEGGVLAGLGLPRKLPYWLSGLASRPAGEGAATWTAEAAGGTKISGAESNPETRTIQTSTPVSAKPSNESGRSTEDIASTCARTRPLPATVIHDKSTGFASRTRVLTAECSGHKEATRKLPTSSMPSKQSEAELMRGIFAGFAWLLGPAAPANAAELDAHWNREVFPVRQKEVDIKQNERSLSDPSPSPQSQAGDGAAPKSKQEDTPPTANPKIPAHQIRGEEELDSRKDEVFSCAEPSGAAAQKACLEGSSSQQAWGKLLASRTWLLMPDVSSVATNTWEWVMSKGLLERRAFKWLGSFTEVLSFIKDLMSKARLVQFA